MEKLAQNLHRPAAARTVRVQEECQMALIESAKSRKLRMDESKLKLQVRQFIALCLYWQQFGCFTGNGYGSFYESSRHRARSLYC